MEWKVTMKNVSIIVKRFSQKSYNGSCVINWDIGRYCLRVAQFSYNPWSRKYLIWILHTTSETRISFMSQARDMLPVALSIRELHYSRWWSPTSQFQVPLYPIEYRRCWQHRLFQGRTAVSIRYQRFHYN